MTERTTNDERARKAAEKLTEYEQKAIKYRQTLSKLKTLLQRYKAAKQYEQELNEYLVLTNKNKRAKLELKVLKRAIEDGYFSSPPDIEPTGVPGKYEMTVSEDLRSKYLTREELDSPDSCF
jgi:DNA repair exonuclease SbcCD ATPase subunit